MKLNKTIGRVATTLVATAMLASLAAVPAFAETPTGEGSQNTMTFTKTLTVNNTTYAPVATFTYSISGTTDKTAVNGVTIKGGVEATKVKINGDGAEDDTAVFTAGETVTGGTITKNVTLDFSSVDFPEPGIYRYKVTESFAASSENPDIVNNTNVDRYIDVTVVNEMSSDGSTPTGKLKISSYAMLDTDAVLVCKDNVYTYVDSTGKPVNAKMVGFTATYTTYDLTLDKVVKGDMGNKGEEFDFTIQFTGGDENEKFSYNNTPYTFDENGQASITGIKLTDASNPIQITGLPSDVSYTVVENIEQSKGYSTSATVNGSEKNVTSAVDKQTVATQTKSQSTDAVVVTNTKTSVTPTGIVMDIAPYALLVVIAAAGCFVFLRKRRED